MVKKNTPIIKEKRNAIIYIIYELLKGKRLSTKDISHLIQRDYKRQDNNEIFRSFKGVVFYSSSSLKWSFKR